jgi:hypothetical protein
VEICGNRDAAVGTGGCGRALALHLTYK